MKGKWEVREKQDKVLSSYTVLPNLPACLHTHTHTHKHTYLPLTLGSVTLTLCMPVL